MKSCDDILYHWLKDRQNNGSRLVRSSDYEEFNDFAFKFYGKTYNPDTFTRTLRKAREDYPWRFEDVSNDFPDRNEKTWKIKQKKGQSHEQKPKHY